MVDLRDAFRPFVDEAAAAPRRSVADIASRADAEIEARGNLDETTGAVECALERRFGNGIIEGQIQAIVFSCVA